MDEHNVHHFYGISPAVDLLAAATSSKTTTAALDQDSQGRPLKLLQVASYDCRHTLQTICRASRHLDSHAGEIHLYIHEEDPEVLARHILLLSVFFDTSLPAKERMEMFLELHGNALLREKTANYLDAQGRKLEAMVVSISSKSGSAGGLESLLDLSMLKFQDKDKLVEAFQKYRETAAYDIIKAWDTRLRKWYGDRYDFRRNMIDWDYHMPLLKAGTPGQDPALGSIIHFHHFRYWRMHGIAFELRDSNYSQANRSMLSTAFGRTKDFVDRTGKNVGRSVAAWGFWGDILNGPYQCFGTVCEEPSFYNTSNKQFTRTAVDIAEHNILAMLQELRTGKPYELPSGSEPHRAKLARGPTSQQDLAEQAAQQQQQQQQQTGLTSPKQLDSVPEGSRQEDQRAADDQQRQGEASGTGMPTDNGTAASAPDSDSGPSFIAASDFEGSKPGYVFRAGDEGLGYYKDSAAVSGTGSCSSAESSGKPPSSNGTQATSSQHAETHSSHGANIQQQMTEEEEALRAEEAAADAEALLRAARFKIVLTTGDLVKTLSGRSKFHDAFELVSVGHRHVHLLTPEYQLNKVAKPGGMLLVETAKYLLQLTKEQAEKFSDKIAELASSSGWATVAQHGVEGLTNAHMVFSKPAV